MHTFDCITKRYCLEFFSPQFETLEKLKLNKEEDSLWKPVISSMLENGQGEEVPFESLGLEPLRNSSDDVFADAVELEG